MLKFNLYQGESMKKILLAISLLGLVLAESNINAFWERRSDVPTDYSNCCIPKEVVTTKNGCTKRRCCRNLFKGPRWKCCRTLRCCKPKKACCPRYKSCPPKPSCCPVEVPVCETTGCVTTPRTTCYEDPTDIARYGAEGTTTCVEEGYPGSYSRSSGNYATSYGEPTMHYQDQIYSGEIIE